MPQKYENILEVNIGLEELSNRRIFRFGINLRDQLGRILVSEEGTGKDERKMEAFVALLKKRQREIQRFGSISAE